MTDRISSASDVFFPIEVREHHLEGLLARSAAFEPFRYYDFRPPVRGPDGVRHPDGALIAPGQRDWWVVEVEIHGHDVETHVKPQLLGLSSAVYGPAALRYLSERGVPADVTSNVDAYEPRFLLVVDHLTPPFRAAAADAGFEVVESQVFRSPLNKYAVAITGGLPSVPVARLEQGVDVEMREEAGVVVLTLVGRGGIPNWLPERVMVGGETFTARTTGDHRIVLAMSPDSCRRLTAGKERYRLTTKGHLVAL